MRNVIFWFFRFFPRCKYISNSNVRKDIERTDLIGVLIAIVLFFYFLKHGVVMVRLIAMIVILSLSNQVQRSWPS